MRKSRFTETQLVMILQESEAGMPVLDLCRKHEISKNTYYKEWRGQPKAIRVDNGPEFISHKLEAWCLMRGVDLQFNRPGTPTDNARIERFNGSFRREMLDAYIFNLK